MQAWQITYDDGRTESVEADLCSEGPSFLIFSTIRGDEVEPFLRIRASAVVRAELQQPEPGSGAGA
jgi:hypothetical protein